MPGFYYNVRAGEALALVAEREGTKKAKRFAFNVADCRVGIFWGRWMAALHRHCAGNRLGERVGDWAHWGSILPPCPANPTTIIPYTSSGPAGSARDTCAHVYHFVSS